MLKVVESFSGIGSQVKALKNIGIEYEIVATMDWDINAIIAYDIIHYGKPNIEKYKSLSKDEILCELKRYTLSSDGKKPMTERALKSMSKIELDHLLSAIKRSKNLASITDVKGIDLPDNIDLFTYSFPCQDLSIAGAWHGNNSGINRNANNRSGMLWEVERILLERYEKKKKLPKFLLMENVSNILSNTHKHNFNEWKKILEDMGYVNYVYTLNAVDFGIPQKRQRVYMLSVQCDNNKEKIDKLDEYMINNNLESPIHIQRLNIKHKSLKNLLRTNYDITKYRDEANKSQPNDTISRKKIYDENEIIYNKKGEYKDIISTITTKQDRNPNSGVIDYDNNIEGKSKFRYLTPRECFLLMGFDEEDYQSLVDNDFEISENKNFFIYSKLYKLAGNSIVVNVLEHIFKQIDYINNELL